MHKMNSSISLRRFGLPFLLLIAFLLRLQGWYPFNVVDEDAILKMVWGLHLDPLPPGMPLPFPGYPPLFMYLNYFLSLLYRELLVFLGVFASAGEYLASPLAQSFVFKFGQILVALLGTLHIAVVWKIGREFFDRRVAWLAVLIVAFHPHLILNGHIFKADVPLAVFFALLLLYALRFIKNQGFPGRLFHRRINHRLQVQRRGRSSPYPGHSLGSPQGIGSQTFLATSAPISPFRAVRISGRRTQLGGPPREEFSFCLSPRFL
jgi:hypothetical protein